MLFDASERRSRGVVVCSRYAASGEASAETPRHTVALRFQPALGFLHFVAGNRRCVLDFVVIANVRSDGVASQFLITLVVI